MVRRVDGSELTLIAFKSALLLTRNFFEQREEAQAILDRLPSGTFLVRISSKQKGNYAISINYNGHVKHIRVCFAGDAYYLSTTKYFKSITDLIKWYEEHSLAESFNGLNVTLHTPYKTAVAANEPIGYAVAMYSFTGNASNLLTLRKGDRVAVLSKAGEEKGWWKGQIGFRVGYFPLAYVTELNEGEEPVVVEVAEAATNGDLMGDLDQEEEETDHDHDKENQVNTDAASVIL